MLEKDGNLVILPLCPLDNYIASKCEEIECKYYHWDDGNCYYEEIQEFLTKAKGEEDG